MMSVKNAGVFDITNNVKNACIFNIIGNVETLALAICISLYKLFTVITLEKVYRGRNAPY